MFTFFSPGQSLDPEQMLWVYKNLPCVTPDGPVTVSINNYRNSLHKKDKPSDTDADVTGTEDAEKIKGYLLRVAPDCAQRAGGMVAFVEVFLGKGSPQAICAVLQMFVDYSGAFIDLARRERAQGVYAQCAAILDDTDISWQDTLQQIADKWLGLDCSGFVGNWLKVAGPELKLNQNVKTNNVLSIARRKVRTLETIGPWDLICHSDNKHIAVVNAVLDLSGGASDNPASLKFDVCQSAGDGPSIDRYSFLSTGADSNGPLFKLASPKKTNIATEFYVISVWDDPASA